MTVLRLAILASGNPYCGHTYVLSYLAMNLLQPTLLHAHLASTHDRNETLHLLRKCPGGTSSMAELEAPELQWFIKSEQ